MAKVHISNVVVLDNPSPFLHPFQFEITFDCIEDLKEDLEWKVVYVGSAESEDYDQILDTVYVGPVSEGRHMFVFQAEAPDPRKIPVADAIGVTVVLLTCSYRRQEFVRVGYYVNNEYEESELRENPPALPLFEKLQRNILATSPRVTRFQIDWNDEVDGKGSLSPDEMTMCMTGDSTEQIQQNSDYKKREASVILTISNENSEVSSEDVLMLGEPEA